jgi:large subunit ribosomal protein L20
MPRSTNSPASRTRRSRILDRAKGFRGSRSKLIRMASEAVDRAMVMSTTHRKTKKRDYRGLWIARVTAACKQNEITYSRLIEGLTKASVVLNRKMLSEIAIHDPAGFTKIVSQAKAGLA